MLVFWVVTPCGFVDRVNTTFGIKSWRRRQYIPPKRWYLPASARGGAARKTNINDVGIRAGKEHTHRLNSYRILSCGCVIFRWLQAKRASSVTVTMAVYVNGCESGHGLQLRAQSQCAKQRTFQLLHTQGHVFSYNPKKRKQTESYSDDDKMN
jgi:hypothetical protein